MTVKITALVTPMQGQTPEDVLFAALQTQHERALIERATAVNQGHLVLIDVRYDPSGGAAEVKDAAERLLKTQSMGVDSLTIVPVKS